MKRRIRQRRAAGATLCYQLAFRIPGILPASAFSLKQILQMPKGRK